MVWYWKWGRQADSYPVYRGISNEAKKGREGAEVSGLISAQSQGDVWTPTAAGTHIWASGLTQLQSLLISLGPDPSQSQQRWSCSPLVVTLGIIGPTP